jgi:hypothetical protein
VRANGAIHERFLVVFRSSDSSFVALRFKARAVERQRAITGCVSQSIRSSRLATETGRHRGGLGLSRKT